MGRSLPTELKQYTFNLLMLIGKEVEAQFAKWNKPQIGFLAKYVAANDRAAKNQTETLKDYDEEKKRTMERTLFMIEVLSVPAVAWLGAALELRVGPKLFYEYKDGFSLPGKAYLYKKVHDEFQSKVFGDAGKDLTDTVFKLANEKINSVDQPEVNPRRISFSPDFDAFGNNLYAEVDKQSTAVQTNINRIAQAVNNSPSFGESLVKRLRKENPALDRMPYDAQFNLGKKLINGMLQANRVNWASAWLFYGSDPPQPDWEKVTKQLERHIWNIWILQQDLHAEKHGWNVFTEDYKVAGASGKVFDEVGGVGESYKSSPVEERLFEEFGAPLQDYELDNSLTTHSKDWADRQAQKLKTWAVSEDVAPLSKQLGGKPRTLTPIDQMW
ncbi:MAG TPA: hypothetical protein VKU19_20925 [Bryobacteraceae bacterium]|nr:hypothetical protein [Bryobacteraceae bacterium]